DRGLRGGRGRDSCDAAGKVGARPDVFAHAVSPLPRNRVRGTERPAERIVTLSRPDSYQDAQARAGGRFRLVTDFAPQGDQAQAVEKLFAGIQEGGRAKGLSGAPGA